MENKDLVKIDSTQLDKQTNELTQKILDDDNLDSVKESIALFNLYQAKKNAARIVKLNNLLDNVSDRMVDRFEKYPDNFSNKDLLDYLQVTQGAIDKANKSLNMVEEVPQISLNQQNNVNINISQDMSRESREKVVDAVQAFLTRLQNPESQQEQVEVTDFKLEEEVIDEE